MAAALAFGRSQAGLFEGLDDITDAGDGEKFVAEEDIAADAIFALRGAITTLLNLRRGPPFADPALAAIIRSFNVSPENAEEILASHGRLLDLPYSPPEPKNRRGRGRPPRRSPLVRAVVRAAMHHLYETNSPFSGGWKYAKSRTRDRTAKRSVGAELTAAQASEFVTNAVRNAGLLADQPEIKGHMAEYIKELNKAGRSPSERDYT